jgi:hypothetical protein
MITTDSRFLNTKQHRDTEVASFDQTAGYDRAQ